MVRWFVVFLLLCIFVGRYWGEQARVKKLSYEGKKVRLEYRVWEEVSRVGGVWVEVRGHIGEKVVVWGEVKKNWVRVEKVQVIDKGNVAIKGLLGIRQTSLDMWSRWLPGDTGSLVGGLVFGATSNLSRGVVDEFRATGLSHILAASGYNLTLFMGWMLVFGKKIFPNKKYLMLFVIFCVICYIFLAGMTPAVWRSAVMSAGLVLAKFEGRKTSFGWWILLSGLLMASWTPSVVGDVGFQLSFAAILGLAIFSPTSMWGTTLAALSMTFPIVWHYFGQISLIALVSNLAVVWLVPLIMQMSMFVTTVGLVWEPLGYFLSLFLWPVATLILYVVHMFAMIPFAAITLQRMPLWGVVGYYVVLLWVKFRWRIGTKL